jgi:hypothetical protein
VVRASSRTILSEAEAEAVTADHRIEQPPLHLDGVDELVGHDPRQFV